MKALVTGGGGFLGSAIVRRLREQGDDVRSFSRRRYEHLAALGVEQVESDLTDATAVQRACDGCDIVYHVAAKAGVWGRYIEYDAANVVGTQNIIDACGVTGVPRLVYTSTPSVVYHGGDIEGGDESLPYPAHFEAAYPLTKAIAEQRVRSANGPTLKTVSLRPHLIWGPGDPHLIPRIVERARRGKLRRIGYTSKKVDVIHVENAAHAHILAGDAIERIGGNVYFITNGEPVDLWDFINRVLARAGLPPVTKSVPYTVAWLAGAMLEGVYGMLRLKDEPPMTRFVARQLATAHWFDISAARRDFGYVPIISIDEGLRQLK